jgi:hypothetical protein
MLLVQGLEVLNPHSEIFSDFAVRSRAPRSYKG